MPRPRDPRPPLSFLRRRRGGAKMVDWYDPRQLLSTGIEVLISAAMGQRFDYRLMEDIGLEQPPFDYRLDREAYQTRTEFWFDFMADTGDGWNSTFAMGSLVAQPTLTVGDRRLPPGSHRELPRGDVLILGGDEVYPFASRQNYRDRLVEPFETALPGDPPDPKAPDLFAIPGNHDWYDGLVSFSRLFIQQRTIGGWRTRQRRSYFALQLPHRWWLWAVDVHLESDIDFGQLHYFRNIAQLLLPRDRVILVSAEPDWLYRDITVPQAESNLAFLETRIIEPTGARVYLWLAGDVHCYRRHEDLRDPNRQRITSGGGGAFLMPTHRPLFGAAGSTSREIVRVGQDEFVGRCVFPSAATSFRLSWLDWLFPIRNWKFGLLTGPAYAGLTWGVVGMTPIALIVFMLVAFTFYADRERPAFRWVGGSLHGAAHVAAALGVASLTGSLATDLVRVLVNAAAGFVVGPLIMGAYLFIAVNMFDAQRSEAFSALRLQDYKHFLRLHVTNTGNLEIFPIGLPRVPRHGQGRGRYVLIEEAVTIEPPAGDPGWV